MSKWGRGGKRGYGRQKGKGEWKDDVFWASYGVGRAPRNVDFRAQAKG
jgi:hypothetical protein